MTRCPRCQRRLPPSGGCPVHGRPSTIGKIVEEPLPSAVAPPGWRIARQIATGGSSLVYAVTTTSGAPAILKWGRWRDRDIHARFEREAHVLRALGPPATPAYLAHGAIDDSPYLLMEEVTGETLAAWMARSGDGGALGEIVAHLIRLATALRTVHAAGFIHRDLKPENVMIGARDTRILDFGLAAVAGEVVTEIGSIVGTVHYMAPEQLRPGTMIDHRCDLYSFGVIAFEMIAGVPPFVGERRAIEYQHQVSRPPALHELRALPRELDDLVAACMAKQPEARPQTIDDVLAALASATAAIETLKGVGTSAEQVLGARERVVVAWIEGGDPKPIARTINSAHGVLVRSRPGRILAAFSSAHHEAPLAVALATCRELARDRCRVVIHHASAFVRRSAQGKPSFYGPEIEQPASWTPPTPFTGLVLTEAAAELAAGAATRAADVPGFSREVARDRTDATEPHREPRLVGRDRLLQEVAAVAGPGGMLIGLSGAAGTGKTRVLAALVERLRGLKHDVIVLRGRRRFIGDRSDDDRVVEALGGTGDLAHVLAEARAIIVVDDAHLLSPAARAELLRDDLAASRVLASPEPLFEVAPGVTRRLAIALPALSYGDAEVLLRELLQPARLIPDVLLQRLAIRAAGNAALLVALARDIRHRGGVRRHPGSNDWYVATDEIDTLLASPSDAWFGARSLEELPVELAPLVRVAAALGPRFSADELAAVAQTDVTSRLPLVVGAGVLVQHGGWYEFAESRLQDAIYDHVLDDRAAIHDRALRYWLEHRSADVVGWLARVAHHAAATGDNATAAACYTTLARKARERGEHAQAEDLEARSITLLVSGAPSAIAAALRGLDDE